MGGRGGGLGGGRGGGLGGGHGVKGETESLEGEAGDQTMNGLVASLLKLFGQLRQSLATESKATIAATGPKCGRACVAGGRRRLQGAPLDTTRAAADIRTRIQDPLVGAGHWSGPISGILVWTISGARSKGGGGRRRQREGAGKGWGVGHGLPTRGRDDADAASGSGDAACVL